jgi:hypothetical protein
VKLGTNETTKPLNPLFLRFADDFCVARNEGPFAATTHLGYRFYRDGIPPEFANFQQAECIATIL